MLRHHLSHHSQVIDGDTYLMDLNFKSSLNLKSFQLKIQYHLLWLFCLTTKGETFTFWRKKEQFEHA